MASLQDQYAGFQVKYLMLTRGKSDEDIKKNYPHHHKINARVSEAVRNAKSGAAQWREGPTGVLTGIKKKISEVTKFAPLAPILRACGIKKENFKPKEQADEKYEFVPVSDKERAQLSKRTKILKIVAKTVLIAGITLILSGIILPTAASLFLILMPQVAALVTIAALTAIGVIGVGAALSYPLLNENKWTREHRVKTDLDFQKFVTQYIQLNATDAKPGFKIKEKDLLDAELHKNYLKWQDAMKKAFSKKNIKKLENERPSN
ncbi:MAG: hypothetical protein VX777_10240 [Chlamydiota bacterium]|nr:hypothetical protein [Chlamydiota bacterium]